MFWVHLKNQQMIWVVFFLNKLSVLVLNALNSLDCLALV